MNEEEGESVEMVTKSPGLSAGVVFIVVVFILILATAITCGVLRLCKKEERVEGGPTYSVAISNRLFKGISRFSFSHTLKTDGSQCRR